LTTSCLFFGFGIGSVFPFLDQPKFVFGQVAPFAGSKATEQDGTDTGANKAQHGMPHGIEHAAHLAIFSFVEHQFEQGGAGLRTTP
jgi:hypothetical protein